MIKLTIELVPSTSWFVNLRNELTNPSDWDLIRKDCYKRARYLCEVCGGRGSKHPVECHELFTYNHVELVQTFERVVSLCPPCHSAKHIGLAIAQNRHLPVVKHLMQVNEWSQVQTVRYIKVCLEEHIRRSRHCWKVDLTNVVRFYGTPLKGREAKK